ncbi:MULTISPECIES: phosphopantetheine-binding protein [Saccharothrix]|uniref:Phosphopantetheine-binding protein n=2 Tax=Saccharothrix TaxID=2071 RepID=A0ABU0WUU9_9PSEU|nr:MULTISPECIES: phosphopantetheine-binding protein [Saccharothrix]MBY8850032.1 phosphopantetheine-binding protein [Saccharothrix sp. MB29]MDQ2583612.1 phosphopantetheine-binding protein [Saccharothrix yanglingensis]MDR6594679.1 polyketide biosynthesis acyl carrier protein [Saccharothrix longispora]MDU0291029.1 phosphopantetheine-binding protein [Saccharothrix longispora]
MTHDEIFAVVRDNLLTVVPDIPRERVTIDAAMSDLGANSIDRAEVVTMTMERLNVVVPVMDFQHVSDIRSLVDLLAERV